MGIRYYAYAFDASDTAAALADPRAFISDDPLADAWGMTPGSRLSTLTGVPRLPQQDLLYLDKAWHELQALTSPRHPGHRPRPAWRMLEGHVTLHDRGWDPWVRALTPDEVPAIAEDLATLHGEVTADEIGDYAYDYLSDATAFAAHQASVGRGFAYLIG